MANKYAAYGYNAAYSAAALGEGLLRVFELNDFEGAIDSFVASAISIIPAIPARLRYLKNEKNSPNMISGTLNALLAMASGASTKPTTSLTYAALPVALASMTALNAFDFGMRELRKGKYKMIEE